MITRCVRAGAGVFIAAAALSVFAPLGSARHQPESARWTYTCERVHFDTDEMVARALSCTASEAAPVDGPVYERFEIVRTPAGTGPAALECRYATAALPSYVDARQCFPLSSGDEPYE